MPSPFFCQSLSSVSRPTLSHSTFYVKYNPTTNQVLWSAGSHRMPSTDIRFVQSGGGYVWMGSSALQAPYEITVYCYSNAGIFIKSIETVGVHHDGNPYADHDELFTVDHLGNLIMYRDSDSYDVHSPTVPTVNFNFSTTVALYSSIDKNVIHSLIRKTSKSLSISNFSTGYTIALFLTASGIVTHDFSSIVTSEFIGDPFCLGGLDDTLLFMWLYKYETIPYNKFRRRFFQVSETSTSHIPDLVIDEPNDTYGFVDLHSWQNSSYLFKPVRSLTTLQLHLPLHNKAGVVLEGTEYLHGTGSFPSQARITGIDAMSNTGEYAGWSKDVSDNLHLNFWSNSGAKTSTLVTSTPITISTNNYQPTGYLPPSESGGHLIAAMSADFFADWSLIADLQSGSPVMVSSDPSIEEYVTNDNAYAVKSQLDSDGNFDIWSTRMKNWDY